MRIAVSQISATTDLAENLTIVEAQTRRAVAEGARLVVFPEATMSRFGVDLSEVAQSLTGPWAESIRAIARAHDVTVIVGMFSPADDGRVLNTLLITGPGVEERYDKIHLYDAFGFAESDTVAPGRFPTIVDIEGIRVGVTTCYDVRFPWLYQELALGGADLITVSASWAPGSGKREQWEVLVRARALDAGTYIAASDQATIGAGDLPGDATPTGVGASMIVSPYGGVLGALDSDPGILVVDIDPALVRVAQNATGCLSHRRAFRLADH